ncbi:dihydrolipoamide acetyltransferase family protein [Rhodococcus sp. NPDC058521]|uniref:dihydrolipoamide acetyltransferase family protein n=1 Tax=Rhodococcus sp. NPDC058521 TaxID=3346536 RepID=UPI003649D423
MAHEFRMPDLGEGLTEAEIVSWSVGVGDRVALNQVIAEVETAKALVELPSPYSGVVEAILVAASTTVPVGTPIIRIAADDSADPGPDESDTHQVLVGYGPGADPPSRRRRAPTPRTVDPARPDASPAARAAARARGIDLTTVRGTGPGGAVTVTDLDSLGSHTETTASTVRNAGVRKQMAAAMTTSAFTAPQVTVFLTVDVTRSMELLDRIRHLDAFEGLSPTPLTLVAKAMVTALRDMPEVNAAWDEAEKDVVQHRYVNLGIAAATSRGLVVPNVKNAENATLAELCRAIHELVETARAGRTTPADLQGGTISITNIGPFGMDTGTPLLNPGEAAILCLGLISKRPWIHEGEVAVRDVTTLSLTFDHRVLDGAQASRFLAAIGHMLDDPAHLMAHL